MAVVCAVSLALGAGCGKGKGGDSSTPMQPGAASAALHMLSTPVHYAQVGEALQYQAVLSKPGAADWVLMAAPNGAKIDQSGSLTWTPGADQGGDHDIAMRASMGGETVNQTVHVTAASRVMEASANVDPGSVNGALIAVDAPLSSIQGTAVQIEPGALPPGTPIAVSIASMANAPVPAAARVAGVPSSDLRPVDFGPTGLAFQVPVKVHLPVTAAVLKKGRPEIQTYDYATGKWEKVKLISVDAATGIAIGEIKHFSTYVVTPPSTVFNLQLSLGSPSGCAAALMVRPALAARFDELPASAVNGYAGKASTLAEVISGLGTGEAVQVYTRVRARGAAATGEQVGWVLASAARLPSGKIKVNVTTDSHGGGFLTTPPELADDDPDLVAWMNGSRIDLVFGGLGALSGGATANAEVSLFAVSAADADRVPPQSTNAVGSDEVTQATLAALDGFDDDCDGAPNQWDPTPQGTPPPQLIGLPPSPVHVAVGSPAGFKVTANQDNVTFTWTASDPSVAITSAMAGAVAAATPAKPGLFHVIVTASNGSTSSRLQWDLIADAPEVMAANTPPRVAIGASAMTVRAGERVVLNAYGKDAEQSQLVFAWYTDDLSHLSAQLGSTVVFAAAAPGDYKVGCIANDGIANSTPAAVVISVISPTANRPPGPPVVAPTSLILQHAAGAPVSAMLKADAADPDGDTVTYDFVPDRFTPPTFTLTKDGGVAAFATDQDGLYLFFVTATDSHGAQSAWTPVKIQVMPTLSMTSVDNDKDGYPAGIDCNDNDPTIHPAAKDICGDGIDQNCDGRDLGAADCDADGDRFTVNQGDCDDTNPAISPGARERCDGIDNNCNGVADEGYGVGVDCSAGLGACRVAAMTICNASFNGVVCGGNPGMPTAEVCDGVDNDCNGQVDDVTATAGGDVNNCGGCNVACTAPANSDAACVKGGCATTCSPGWVDTDRRPENGCECQLTNAGVEICDGVDNDCNGSVDDGAGAVFYDGPAGTQGIGVCSAGARACKGGMPVTLRAQQIPTPELCDGLDNDCNGKVDDGFDFTTDPRNCGGCNIACADGKCEGGKCAGGTIMPPGGGSGGRSGTDDAGVPLSDGGGSGPPPTTMPMLVICSAATGQLCTDLAFDSANCGACGHACGVGSYCNNGVCMDPASNCGPPKLYCKDSVDPNKGYCTDPMYDPGNCGGCGIRCPNGPCQAGVCQNGSPTGDGGVPPVGDGGVSGPSCDPMRPNSCPSITGGLMCTDFRTDPANCGGCGKICGPDMACVDGACLAGRTATCIDKPLSPCGTICTTLNDDPINCGVCGKTCDGVCAAATCQPAGTGKFGDPCKGNSDCGTGAMCMDEARFGWPGGYCSAPCSPTRACPGTTTCVLLGSGFGTCRQKCGTDAECGATRPGFVCNVGFCAPDCRQGPNVCDNGQVCDTTTGHCAPCAAGGNCGGTGAGAGGSSGTGTTGTPGGTIMCPVPMQLCTDPTGAKQYCSDVNNDPGNCGGCGKICPANAVCTMGVCQGGGGGAPGLAACAGTNGAPVCTNLYYDNANCGACGTICQGGTFCQGGMCLAPPTCMAPQQLCSDPTGTKRYCTDVTVDGANCGACGNFCGAGSYCMAGKCVAGTPPVTCPAPLKFCNDPTGKMYCARVEADPGNCGACGVVCPGGTFCQNFQCVPSGTATDGGTPTGPCADPMAKPCPDTSAVGYHCASVMSDPMNCGGCGAVCPNGTFCSNYRCTTTVGGDGGTSTGPCADPMAKQCPDPTSPGGYRCINTAFDPMNCGTCGFVCPTGVCQNYVCGGATTPPPACTDPMAKPCPDPTSPVGYKCVNPAFDPMNCGGCGFVCPNGVCQNYSCNGGTATGDGGTTPPPACTDPMAKPCPDPTSPVGYKCINPAFDPMNCGMCGFVCPSGVCQNYACSGGTTPPDGGTTTNCPAPAKICQNAAGTYCANLAMDPGNCGQCGFVCPAGTYCSNYSCMSTTQQDGGTPPPPPTCTDPMLACKDPATGALYCSDIRYDNNNCGACGRVCSATTKCVTGMCTAP